MSGVQNNYYENLASIICCHFLVEQQLLSVLCFAENYVKQQFADFIQHRHLQTLRKIQR